MELSSRDKRILAEIECESALEDPKWVRRLERLGRDRRERRGLLRRLWPASVTAVWVAAVVLGCSIAPRWLLWAALGLGVLAALHLLVRRRRRRQGPRAPRRRIPRIPRQGEPRGEGDVTGP
jgi:Protein of unknown function (DUF3040)